ncbi:hypothetical protein DFQ28_002149 [Apophysomyces sp. BC1034]|nr:hypothetical protein DFQ30_007612 [Apophysomyces sp. BC1015]KAG0179804.1 hypothetical protein DFQ29_001651 [Apophysomyces sp. BC1021]KAG0190370.1 hypothetical protein DFQ28_002149 [Apophysomyces sp. BC1034]
MLDKNDPATYNHQYCNVNGIRQHYVDENPTGKEALILFHGWPDLWLGWREQIQFLVNLGYRVIVPSMRGFGQSDAPADPAKYGYKTVCRDMAELLDHLELPTVTVLGHDWGGFVAWRFAQFYPERVRAVASFCSPYLPSTNEYLSLEQIVERLPTFKYQLYFANDPEAVRELDANIDLYFKRLFRNPEDKKLDKRPGILDPVTHKLVEGREVPARSDAVPKKVLDYYIEQFQRAGAAGGLNWYKQTRRNWEDCKDLDPIIRKPSLMITAENDPALPPSMAADMHNFIPDLETYLVEGAGHFVLTDKPEECNNHLERWLAKVTPL